MGGEAARLDRQALDIVERCMELEGDEREALLAASCADAPELEARVRRLLAMEKEAPDLLSTRVIDEHHADPDPVPERVGKFRVTGLIGRGGMGMVVRAERDDGIYRQSVAIKLIRAGLRGERERERFAMERRLLARLSHPSIARILDGGEQDGRPYLVMELVEGRPVTEDLRDRAAGLEEALDRFAAVGEAVSHAHRNLVIHGDIKPSNVLSAADGGVKLLDFGIGRMADLDPGAEAYPLTPAYAAPERQAGEPPTVASDVYSLAVLLHEMLADRLPREGHVDLGEGTSRMPRGAIPGDLAAIVAMGLSADPARRYPDVAALLADIARFRNASPVVARPPSAGHGMRLFLRRHRWGAAVAAAFALILTAATVVSLSLYVDARRQRSAAEARFDELRSLAKFQLFDLYDQLAESPGTTAARARLAAEAQLYLDRLAAADQAPADLRLDIARGLNRLSSVQGVPRVPNLGQPERARANLIRSASLLAALQRESSSPAVAIEQARNLVLRALIAIWLDFRIDEARRLLEAAAPLASARSAEAREVEALRRTAWLDMLGWDENYTALRAGSDATLQWLDAWPGERPLVWHLTRIDATNARGDALYYLGDARRALSAYRSAEAMADAAARRWPRRAAILTRQAMSAYNVVSTTADNAVPAQLVVRAQALVRQGDQLVELEPNDVALRRRHLISREMAAQILTGAGRRGEALALQAAVVTERERLARRASAEPRALRDLAFSQSVLGNLNWSAGRREAACSAWASARQGFETLAAAGQLNRFDRERTLARIRFNLEICSGARPASAYQAP